MFKGVVLKIVFFGLIWTSLVSGAELNRPEFKHKEQLPPLPAQTASYINIANYNIRYDYPKFSADENAWSQRQEYYFASLNREDEAAAVMRHMQEAVRVSLSKHFPNPVSGQSYGDEPDCQTCEFAHSEPYPILDTKHFRIALKTSLDMYKIPYGNFPYPYRLIIALKRHGVNPTEEEWAELRQILQLLETEVRDDLGAEYTSYAVLQDVYHRHRAQGKAVPSEPHFFLHFIFRFPVGKQVMGIPFTDPNPYFQFNLHESTLVKEGERKAKSNFIYKRGADIITTQELTYRQAEDMKKNLSLHRFVGYTAHDGRSMHEVQADDWIGEIVAIAYRSDRLHCIDSGVRWLSATPDRPSMPEGASRRRIIVWAKFRDQESHRCFYVFNTHYDHLGGRLDMVKAELDTIKSVAGEELWFATGERFYQHHSGDELYEYYLDHMDAKDVRDSSLMGHYGEAGTWGGFAGDPYACAVRNGDFDCDTLDVFFSNAASQQIILSYHFSGAYDPRSKTLYPVNAAVADGYRLASDHFMSGIYIKLD